jgi:hypothetical protein
VGLCRDDIQHALTTRLFALNCHRAISHDNVSGKRKQFCCVFAIAFGIACAPAGVDPQVAADGPTQTTPSPPLPSSWSIAMIRHVANEH